MYSELDNQHHIKEIGSRLNSSLWDAWRDRVFSIKKKHTRYPTFDEFVTDKADEANDPVYGLEPSIDSPARCQTPSVPKSATVMNNVNSSDIRRKPCVVCDEQHPVFLCRDFKNMSVSTRSNVVVKFKLCINCLKSGHDVAKCEKQSYCRAPDCTIKHNSLLHENVVANHTIDTNVCNNICMPVATALVRILKFPVC